jgi:hypothetical protein
MHYSAFDGKAVADPFLHAFGKIVTLRESILEDCLLVQKELFDSTEADLQQQALRDEMQMAAEMVRHCIEENALKAEDQTESLRQYEQYTQHYEKLKKKYDALLIHQRKRKEDHNRLSQSLRCCKTKPSSRSSSTKIYGLPRWIKSPSVTAP